MQNFGFQMYNLKGAVKINMYHLTPPSDQLSETDETRENLQILRNTSLSQEPRVAAHAALEEDADLESLNTP